MKLLLLCVLVALPGAFVGLCMGSTTGYEKEFNAARRNYQDRPESHPVLRAYEAAGIVIGSVPGVAFVLWNRKRTRQ